MRYGPTSAVSALLHSGRGEAEEWERGGEGREGGMEGEGGSLAFTQDLYH